VARQQSSVKGHKKISQVPKSLGYFFVFTPFTLDPGQWPCWQEPTEVAAADFGRPTTFYLGRFTKMGDCCNCSWYENGICHNPDAEYLEKMEPEDGCTLWEED